MQIAGLTRLPPDVLLRVLQLCSTRELCSILMPSCRCLLESSWSDRAWEQADVSGLGQLLLHALEQKRSLLACSSLRCHSVLQLVDLSLAKLTKLNVSGCGMDWTATLFRDKLPALRVLHVETRNTLFAKTADVWASDAFPCLEELCWSIRKVDVKNRSRRQAYTKFLQTLGRSLSPDFAARRPRFRVSAYNGRPPPEKLTSWCSICGSMLVQDEPIFALGPGTQPHIDCEAFVWGTDMKTLSAEGPGAWTCPQRCHDAWDLFLVAGRGCGISICGFKFGLACGPRLACVAPERELGSRWMEDFLADPSSLRARPMAVRAMGL